MERRHGDSGILGFLVALEWPPSRNLCPLVPGPIRAFVFL